MIVHVRLNFMIPHQLDLLCRRMVLLSYHPAEVVFKQGDEGEALFIVFTGTVEVKVSQYVLGDPVEVTVCELSKGEFFGERALMNDEPRAASVVAKDGVELVQISREDYNAMLKQNQQDFVNRVSRYLPSTGFKSAQEGYRRILRKKPSTRTKREVYELSQFVQNLKFFRGMVTSFTRELCTVIDLSAMSANSIVFREGEIGELFYIILTGSVDIKVNSKDSRGRDQMTKITTLNEGAHFGELALMKGHGKRSATIITAEPCEFLTLSEHDYNTILKRVQKDDLNQKVNVLHKIPMFQSTVWTPEILEELAYVMTDSKVKLGSTLYKQGTKALEFYIIKRGEGVITRDTKDPKTGETYSVFVRRFGPYSILGASM